MRPGGYLSKWEYFLTIEHDNVPPPDGVLNLIVSMNKRPELAAISGLYWTKGEGGVKHVEHLGCQRRIGTECRSTRRASTRPCREQPSFLWSLSRANCPLSQRYA